MPITSSLMKSTLHNSIADGIYNEITTKYSRYYYFLGRTLAWENDLTPPAPVDSHAYEFNTRNEIITMKQINETDVSYVVSRYNWVSGSVYDQYDDQYSTEVQGINLFNGGYSYGSAPNVYVGSTGAQNWAPNTAYGYGDMIITTSSKVYVVTDPGTTGSTAPSFTTGTALNGTATLQYINHNDQNGTGATAEAIVLDGAIIGITLTHRGIGYTGNPTVTIIGGGGSGANAEGVVIVSPSMKQRLEDCTFYVLTDEFNVYQCIDNYNGAISIIKPTGTSSDFLKTSDNYIWKFLYSIPIALRNKFLTDAYMPVITALRNQFYSAGVLNTIRIDQAGSGYISGNIIVQGDGTATSEPKYITSYSVDSGGSGYTDATITVDPPFDGVSPWLPEQVVLVGQKLTYQNNIYKIAVSGTTNTIGPVHRKGIVANGSASLEYIGTNITADAVLDGGSIVDLIVYGMVRDTEIISNGAGYTSAPTVTFSGGNGISASGLTVLQNGSVTKIIITDPGIDYTSAPDITLGTEWESSMSVNIGDQIFYSNRLYTVTGAGTTGSTGPVHLSGSASNGTATLNYAGIPATAVAYIKYGSGYSAFPQTTITSQYGSGASVSFNGIKTEAKLLPIFANDTLGDEWQSQTAYGVGLKVWYSNKLYTVTTAGTSGLIQPTHSSGSAQNGSCILRYEGGFGQLIGVQVDDPGVGYTYATLTVTGTGSGASISADLSPGNVDSLQANIELLAVDGRIVNCPMISGGYNYTSANVTINGDGSGATATAEIANGSVTRLNITNYGSGYRWATITIDGNGYGATARAIIGPYGGYGKEALNNLYAITLMFYSNISLDKNQGFTVNNDYRQVGIIKIPRQYNNTNNLTSILASGCWVISGITNPTLFPPDSIITRASDSAKFRIVTNTSESILAQSIDNAIPVIGNVFSNSASDLFVVSAISPPTVDKYSGDLLFIDNKAAFTPTTDETVTLRTVIKF